MFEKQKERLDRTEVANDELLWVERLVLKSESILRLWVGPIQRRGHIHLKSQIELDGCVSHSTDTRVDMIRTESCVDGLL